MQHLIVDSTTLAVSHPSKMYPFMWHGLQLESVAELRHHRSTRRHVDKNMRTNPDPIADTYASGHLTIRASAE